MVDIPFHRISPDDYLDGRASRYRVGEVSEAPGQMSARFLVVGVPGLVDSRYIAANVQVMELPGGGTNCIEKICRNLSRTARKSAIMASPGTDLSGGQIKPRDAVRFHLDSDGEIVFNRRKQPQPSMSVGWWALKSSPLLHGYLMWQYDT